MTQQQKTKRNKARMIKQLCKFKGVVRYAANAVGITRKTHYEWLKTDDDYKEQVEEIQFATNDLVENKLFELIDDLNPSAIMFYLRTKGRSNGYTDNIDVNHSGEIKWEETKTYDKDEDN